MPYDPDTGEYIDPSDQGHNRPLSQEKIDAREASRRLTEERIRQSLTKEMNQERKDEDQDALLDEHTALIKTLTEENTTLKSSIRSLAGNDLVIEKRQRKLAKLYNDLEEPGEEEYDLEFDKKMDALLFLAGPVIWVWITWQSFNKEFPKLAKTVAGGVGSVIAFLSWVYMMFIR